MDHSNDRIIATSYVCIDGQWTTRKQWNDGSVTTVRHPDERHARAEAERTAHGWLAECQGRER